MLVRCTSRTSRGLPEALLGMGPHGENSEFSLVKGKAYVAYGLTVCEGFVWYYVCDEGFIYYPVKYPSSMFSLQDSRVSRHWVASIAELSDKTNPELLLAFPEWAADPGYYERLVDGEDEAVRVLRHYKTLMDVEFPNPSLALIAEDFGDGWLRCPECAEPWEPDRTDGVVKCPSCSSVMNNPLWV